MAKLISDGSLKIQNLSAVEVERIEPLDIMALIRAAWRGKWLLGSTTALAVTLGGYYAFAMAKPQYAATATLQIEADSRPVVDVQQVVSAIATDQASINTEVAILRSRHLLAKLVSTLDLQADPEFNRYLAPPSPYSMASLRTRLRNLLAGTEPTLPDDDAVLTKTIENLQRMISAGILRDTHIFRITATTGDPAKSALIANSLAELYIADQIDAKYAATENAVTWLSERVYDLQVQLETKETQINELIASQQVNDANVLDALSRQSTETNERLLNTRQALQEAQAKLAQFDVTPTLAASGSAPDQQQLQADVQRFADQAAALEAFQAGIETEIASQSSGLVRLQQLRREADATRVLYETFLTRLQETSIQRGLQTADSRILSLATPGGYVAPRKMFILMIAAVLGVLSGLIILLVQSMLRRGFRNVGDLAQTTGLPVFTQTPTFPVRRRSRLIGYLNAKPTSATAESIRNLRTSLLLADKGHVPKVILTTSSLPGEGKTTLSIALAHNLAGLGNRVLLIDADMRRSALSKYFPRIGVGLGLSSLSQEAILHDPMLGADILPAGTIDQSPADLLTGQPFASFIQTLRQAYDFIVIDAPPVLPVPDARLLAQHADTTLYAVRWEKTNARLVLAGQQALSGVHAKIGGLVLSRVNVRRMRQYGEASFAYYGRAYHQN